MTRRGQGGTQGGDQGPREFSPAASLTPTPCPEQRKQPSGRQTLECSRHPETAQNRAISTPEQGPSLPASARHNPHDDITARSVDRQGVTVHVPTELDDGATTNTLLDAQARHAEPAAAHIQDAITRIVESAPPLTNAQRDRLAALLRPTAGTDIAAEPVRVRS